MGTFGDPQYANASPEELAAAAASPDAAVEMIDPNDPALVSEALDTNLDGDAYARPAPPPAGIYRAKLKLVQTENAAKQKVDWYAARWGKQQPQLVAVASVEASLIDPSGKYDGIHVYDRNVSTFAGRDKSHKIGTILGKLKRPDGSPWVRNGERMPPAEWANRLVQALAGEPECGIEIDWEWSCAGCAKHAKDTGGEYPRRMVGMSRFPPEQDPAKRRAGNLFSPEMKCQVNPAHMYSRCQLVVARVLSLAELQAVKGQGTNSQAGPQTVAAGAH